MKDIDKVKREANRIAAQANEFQFKAWHVAAGAVVVALAAYGAITLLGKLGVL